VKKKTMQNRDIIVIGASAGGFEAIRRLVAGLPAGLPASCSSYGTWRLM